MSRLRAAVAAAIRDPTGHVVLGAWLLGPFLETAASLIDSVIETIGRALS